MKQEEAMKLKIGDLVVIDNRNKCYGGLIMEIEQIKPDGDYCYRMNLKQPGINSSFRITDYDSRHLKKYEEGA